MTKPVEFKITGIKETIDVLEKKGVKTSKLIEQSMEQISLYLEGEVKQSISGHRAEYTSVDTGKFLGSVKGEHDSSSATIATNVEYAQFLEYGTKHITPRSHFRNSLYRNKDKVASFVRDKLKKEL